MDVIASKILEGAAVLAGSAGLGVFAKWMHGRGMVAATREAELERVRDAYRQDYQRARESEDGARRLLEETRTELAKVREAHIRERLALEEQLFQSHREATQWKERAEQLENRVQRLERTVAKFRKQFNIQDDSGDNVTPFPGDGKVIR
jgi:phage shock protein A